MDVGEIGGWVKTHPVPTAAIVFTGGLALLWMLGYIGGGAGASASSGGNNLAAFYGAEAASAQAGAAVQLATLQTAAQTAQTKIQADAATVINAAQTNAAQIINGQNVGAAVQRAGIDSATTLGLSWNQDLATFNNNATTQFVTKTNADAATAQNFTNNAYAAQIAASHDNANLLQTALQTVIPNELNRYGSAIVGLPGIGTVNALSGNTWDINGLISMGYTPAQAAAKAGV